MSTVSQSPLYDALIKRRDAERERTQRSIFVISGADLPVENTPQGLLRWYMHPDKPDTAHMAEIFYAQEIPPGSRSGRQKSQGGMVIFFSHGRGYTMMEGIRYDWEAGDLLQLPYREEGVVVQHFNASETEPAGLVAAEPNLVAALGVDRGAGFEQLAPAPEYRPPARKEG